MNAAMPKDSTAPTPGTNSAAGLIGAAEKPSVGLAKATTSNTITTRNSRTTSAPSTLAERSTRFTPIQAMTAMQPKTNTHHGMFAPVFS